MRTKERDPPTTSENPSYWLNSDVLRIDGANWFVAGSEGKKWLVTNHPIAPPLGGVTLECTER